jgi:hypothetical protein
MLLAGGLQRYLRADLTAAGLIRGQNRRANLGEFLSDPFAGGSLTAPRSAWPTANTEPATVDSGTPGTSTEA